MYGLTRATTTLIAAGVAGLLLWVATQINDKSTGGYWAVYGIIAGAGLVMALSQLLGGWTKWGVPRLSGSVFLLAFIPVLIAAGWVVLGAQPHSNWFRSHVLRWSGDIHIRGLVRDLAEYVAVLAFGIGLVLGYSFDTTGPRVRGETVVGPPRRRFLGRRRAAATASPATDRPPAEEPGAAGRPATTTPTRTVDEPPPAETTTTEGTTRP